MTSSFEIYIRYMPCLLHNPNWCYTYIIFQFWIQNFLKPFSVQHFGNHFLNPEHKRTSCIKKSNALLNIPFSALHFRVETEFLNSLWPSEPDILFNIGSGKGLSRVQQRAITWNNVDLLSIGSQETEMFWNFVKNTKFCFHEVHLENIFCKMATVFQGPMCW